MSDLPRRHRPSRNRVWVAEYGSVIACLLWLAVVGCIDADQGAVVVKPQKSKNGTH